MHQFILFLASLLVVGKLGAADPSKPQEAIQGTWEATRMEVQGKEIPDAAKQELKIVITADELFISRQGMPSARGGKCTIDFSHNPWSLQIADPSEKFTVKGIAKFEGGNLILAINNVTQIKGQEIPEPTSFSTNETAPYAVITLTKSNADARENSNRMKAEAAAALQARQNQKRHLQIYQSLITYAFSRAGNSSAGPAFPSGKTSNEAFRKLFVAKLLDDEKLFSDRADGKLGDSSTNFGQTLEPDECDVSYVAGLAPGRSDATLPLLWTSFVGADGVSYTSVVAVDGKPKTYATKDGVARATKNGQEVDVFTEQYGTNPKNIVQPEVSRKTLK